MRAALVLVFVLSRAAALACPRPMLTELPLTKDGATLVKGGGVVMHVVAGGGRGGDFESEGGGALFDGAQALQARTDYLAPGLTVLVPPAQSGRTIEMRNRGGERLLALVQGDVAPKHLAPKLARVTSTLTAAQARRSDVRRGPYGGAVGQFTIELAGGPPADVLALVLYTAGNDDAGIAYALPQPGQKAYTFGFGGKNCGGLGAGQLAQGTKVHAAWVDESGRLSILGKSIAVTAAPAPKP